MPRSGAWGRERPLVCARSLSWVPVLLLLLLPCPARVEELALTSPFHPLVSPPLGAPPR